MLSILALVLSLFAADPAAAQGCGPQNPNCIVPTAPVGTSNNQAASTEFVANALAGSLVAGTNITISGTNPTTIATVANPVFSSTNIGTANQSITISPTGNTASTLASLTVQGSAISLNSREFLSACGLTSAIGSGGAGGNDKVCFYSGMVGQSGTSNIWSANFLTQQAAASGSYVAHVLEVDLDNLNADRLASATPTSLSAPYSVGIEASGRSDGAAFRSTAAYAVNGAKWQFGYLTLGNVSQAAFYESVSSTIGLDIQGTHTTGIRVASGGVIVGQSGASSGAIAFIGQTSGNSVLVSVPTATAAGNLTLPAATDTLIGKATTDTLTNKTFDTAGTGNVFRINGTGITAVTGTGSVVLSASPTITGTLNTAAITASGTITENGATNSSLVLNKSASGNSNNFQGSTAGSARWIIAVGNNTAEGGGNSGSDFTFSAFDDGGAFIANWMVITRSNGIFTLSGTTASTSSATGAFVSAGGLGVAKAGYFGQEVTTGVTTVAALPACNAGRKGAHHFVSDGNTANAFRGAVTGGGANNQWVTCDGTNWLQG